MFVGKAIFKLIFFVAAALLLLFLIKFFDLSYPLAITTTTRSTELAVVGEGKVEVVPDTVYVDAGITVDNVASVEEAQKTIDEVNNKLISAMKDLGIKKEDIKTSNYSLYPSYTYKDDTRGITGYSGNATVTIKVGDAKLASQVMTKATEAGANQIHGTRFVVDKPEKYREEARLVAIENAKSQAEKLAQKLGIRLGKIVNMVESSPDRVYPFYANEKSAPGGGGPVIEPGSQTITSTVTLYFERK